MSNDSGDIALKVGRVGAKVLNLPADAADGADITRADTPGWDSLKNLEVFFALEDAFGVEFSEDEFTRHDSTAALAAAITQKTNAA